MDYEDNDPQGSRVGGLSSESSLSSSDWEDDSASDEAGAGASGDCVTGVDRAHEADDEQSDWPGHEAMPAAAASAPAEARIYSDDEELNSCHENMTSTARQVHNPFIRHPRVK